MSFKHTIKLTAALIKNNAFEVPVQLPNKPAMTLRIAPRAGYQADFKEAQAAGGVPKSPRFLVRVVGHDYSKAAKGTYDATGAMWFREDITDTGTFQYGDTQYGLSKNVVLVPDAEGNLNKEVQLTITELEFETLDAAELL